MGDPHISRRAGLLAAVVLVAAGCGGGSTGMSSGRTAVATPGSTPTVSPTTLPTGTAPAPGTAPQPLALATPAPGGAGDDWTTYAHDDRRSGAEPQPVGFDRTTVANLTLAWHVQVTPPVKASPIVAGGVVYIAAQSGDVVALDAATGTVRWRVNLGGEIAMTPELDRGMLLVATHLPPATMFALDAATGAVRWSRTFDFALRSEPVVLGGTVVMGLAGGDPPACRNGGLVGLDEVTGATRWQWAVDPTPGAGGSVWGPISTDGTRIYAGTGNTCKVNSPQGNAVVALTPAGTPAWNLATVDSRSDDDIGGGVLILGGQLVVTSKDATLRVLATSTGALVESTALPAADGYGGIGTPTTDGTTLIVSAGWLTDPTIGTGSTATLLGYDVWLHERWRITTRVPVAGYVAIAAGMGFASLDDKLVALDPGTGTALWSASLSSPAYASPVVVPSGVYTVDNAGDVYAFRIGSATSAHRRNP